MATILLPLLLLLHSSSPSLAQPTAPPPPSSPQVRFDKSMAIVLVIVVVVFFALGFISVYSRQCAERRFRGPDDFPTGNSDRHSRRGLEPEIIRTFPTFVYSTVKDLKIGKSTLECAVCLNEFQDHETLRFIPICSHVFHPACIDLWLSSHYTCPVCRANLVPRSDDVSFVSVQIPVSPPESDHQQHAGDDIIQHGEPSPKNNNDSSPSPRSGIWSLFPRSHSTGHSLVSTAAEDRERYTLRLPEEVRRGLIMRPAFERMSSERSGYRTRSVGSGTGVGRFDRFRRDGRSDWWRFIHRNASTSRDGSRKPHDAIGERSTDRLCAEQSED